ncbi:MAG: ADP-ribosylglycohydrolase family protein [Oscillospiraceae bacterium]|nr:ADP-ribosylglycohydrolase family protein [Oscillospiraceae bacterium]
MIDMKKRIAGALFGVAVGDALGGPVEFMGPDQIAAKYGRLDSMIGGGWLSLAPGEITDDTQMTLCVAEGIVEAPDDPVPAIGRRFIEWANARPKDIGGACAHSIHNAQRAGGASPNAEQWEQAAEATQRSTGRPVEGNGALMRTVYPGLFYASRARVAENAQRIAQMTHAGKRSTEACILYTSMVHLLTASESDTREQTQREFLAAHVCAIPEYWVAAINDTVAPASGGWVVDAMRIAVGSLATTGSFREAVVTAVNLGGDADTNGAITGGLAGAWYGYDAIPADWISALAPEVREDLVRLTNAAYDARRE